MFSLISCKEVKTVIEKSKFFSFSYNCYSIEEQNKILKEIKRNNLSATHICYASVIYKNNDVLCYSSDDGEPSGTAGLQILQALKENNMINVLCVVVRYFGGIKLGVAGLGRAYKDCALKTIIDNKYEVKLKKLYFITCDYNKYNVLKSYFVKNNIQISDLTFNNDVNFNAYLVEEEYEKIKDNVNSIQEKDDIRYC